MNTNNNIKEVLAHNFTIKSNSAMTGEQVGIEAFAQWKNAITNCHREFYKYEVQKHICAGQGNDAVADATKAFNCLQVVLDLVGEVNGHKVYKNLDMLNILSTLTLATKEPLAGKAETLNSELKIVRKQLADISNGMNEDYVKGLETREAELAEELKLEKRKTGSCSPLKERNTETTFRKKFEKELYRTVILKQEMKSWEEIEAEEQARKEARKEAARKRKAAKKAQEQAQA